MSARGEGRERGSGTAHQVGVGVGSRRNMRCVAGEVGGSPAADTDLKPAEAGGALATR
jgi:hypothetical protein